MSLARLYSNTAWHRPIDRRFLAQTAVSHPRAQISSGQFYYTVIWVTKAVGLLQYLMNLVLARLAMIKQKLLLQFYEFPVLLQLKSCEITFYITGVI